MCSILWWILYNWEALGLHFFQIWAMIHALATRGRKKGGERLHCIPSTYPKSQGGACAFLMNFWLLGGVVCCTKSVWLILVTGLTGLVKPVWLVLGTGMTGLCPELALVQGSSCMLWWFVLFAWAWFCLRFVERFPLPKGSETCLLQVILLFAFLDKIGQTDLPNRSDRFPLSAWD
jgi:hypothetical protein